MNAAQVGHQHAVNKNPHIVIAGEVVGHRLLAVNSAAVFLHKAGGHGQAEVVIDSWIFRIDIRLCECAVIFCKRRSWIHKGEKLPGRATPSVFNSPSIIEYKFLCFLIEPCIVFLTVVVIVTVLINLEQPANIGERQLAVVIHFRIEQIIQ